MGKTRGNRAKNWLHQLRLLGEDKVGKNPGWVIIWRRVKENKSFIRIHQRIEWSWEGRPWKWDGDEYNHYKLMDTSKGERAKEKALRFQIRTEQRSSGGSPWVGRKLDSGFCALLTVILPDFRGKKGPERLHPNQQWQEDVGQPESPRAGAEIRTRGSICEHWEHRGSIEIGPEHLLRGR